MPETCEECGKESGYDGVVILSCDLGYNHPICKECITKIKKKARKIK